MSLPTPVSNQASRAGYTGAWSSDLRLTSPSLDTGTTLIIGPVAAVEKLFKQLGVEIYKQKGSTYGLLEAGKKAPEINIAVGDKKITLNDETAIFGKDDKGKSILSIVGEDLGYGDVWILGDAWLRNFVSIWDRGQNRFGIADIVKNAK